tara:strand:+ start:246 stop:554 length:309 start_codon:yes stop_codon:yes gene_type:complete
MKDQNRMVSSALLKSLILKYLSEIETGRATMLVYLTNPVGIGEHPQHLEEMDKLITSIESAESKIECLKKYFNGGVNDLLGFSMNVAGVASEHHYTNVMQNL